MNTAEHSWFYAEGDEQRGPVPFEQIQQAVNSGALPAHTLIWCKGQADWLPYREIVATIAPSPIAADQPGNTTLPQGPAEPSAHPLPIPATLKRASFVKLMVVSGIAIVLLIATLVLVFMSMGSLSSGSDPLLGIITAVLGMAALGMIIWSVVISMIYVYRAWLMIQAFGASCTPGIAVGFQFIPLFNLYWAFRAYHGWSRDYNNAIRSDPRLQGAPVAGEGLFLTYCICNAAAFPFNILSNVPGLEIAGAIDGLISLVSLIVLIIMFAQICGAINFFVDARDRDAVGRS